MAKQFNPNLKALVWAYNHGYNGCCMEGSSRSGKTFSAGHFLVWLTNRAAMQHQQLTVNIIRETYNSFKTTLYNDFNKILPQFGQQNPFADSKEIATFHLLGSKINMIGADRVSKFEGLSGDITWFNEFLDIPNSIFDAAEQRTQRFWMADWNPKFSDHWVFRKVLKRPDVHYIHTTFKDNPHISKIERDKLLSYDPSNPVNVANGTADDYMWSVYGLGLRSAPEGLIFPNVTWIDELPEDVHKVMFGLDLGYTNSPAAFVEVRVNGRNLYAKKHLYHPFETASAIEPLIAKILPVRSQHFWVDSADPIFIGQLRQLGLSALGVKKSPNYKKGMIANLKGYKLHLVRDQDVQLEQENYKFRVINGIKLDDPIDGYDHFWDAVIYATMHELFLT